MMQKHNQNNAMKRNYNQTAKGLIMTGQRAVRAASRVHIFRKTFIFIIIKSYKSIISIHSFNLFFFFKKKQYISQ